jgi:hypothetical protein
MREFAQDGFVALPHEHPRTLILRRCIDETSRLSKFGFVIPEWL